MNRTGYIIDPYGKKQRVSDLDTLVQIAIAGAIDASTIVLDEATRKTFVAGDHPYLKTKVKQQYSLPARREAAFGTTPGMNQIKGKFAQFQSFPQKTIVAVVLVMIGAGLAFSFLGDWGGIARRFSFSEAPYVGEWKTTSGHILRLDKNGLGQLSSGKDTYSFNWRIEKSNLYLLKLNQIEGLYQAKPMGDQALVIDQSNSAPLLKWHDVFVFEKQTSNHRNAYSGMVSNTGEPAIFRGGPMGKGIADLKNYGTGGETYELPDPTHVLVLNVRQRNSLVRVVDQGPHKNLEGYVHTGRLRRENGKEPFDARFYDPVP